MVVSPKKRLTSPKISFKSENRPLSSNQVVIPIITYLLAAPLKIFFKLTHPLPSILPKERQKSKEKILHNSTRCVKIAVTREKGRKKA